MRASCLRISERLICSMFVCLLPLAQGGCGTSIPSGGGGGANENDNVAPQPDPSIDPSPDDDNDGEGASDVCVENGWYGDGICHDDCPELDPDCEVSVDVTYWAKVFGGDGTDQLNHASEAGEGNFITTGMTKSHGRDDYDAMVALLDSGGDILWQTIIGGEDSDTGYSISSDGDSGYILRGSTSSAGSGESDALIAWLDESGTVLSQMAIGGSGSDYVREIIPQADGGYLIMGSTDSCGAGEKDMYWARLEHSGEIVWQETLGGTDNEYADGIVETSDGGYVLLGSTRSFGNDYEILVVRMDDDANIVWERAFRTDGTLFAETLGATADGGFIVGAYGFSFDVGRWDTVLLRFDHAGDIVWQYVYGTQEKGTNIETVIELSTGGFIVTGDLSGEADDDAKAYMLRLDEDGSIVWQTTFGGELNVDFSTGVQETADGGFVLAGCTKSFGEEDLNAIAVRVNDQGIIPGCPYSSAATGVTRVPAFLESSETSLSVATADLTSLEVQLPVVVSDFEAVTICDEDGYSEERTPSADEGAPVIVGCNSVRYEGHLFTNIGCAPGISSFSLTTTQGGHSASFHVQCSFAGCVSGVW